MFTFDLGFTEGRYRDADGTPTHGHYCRDEGDGNCGNCGEGETLAWRTADRAGTWELAIAGGDSWVSDDLWEAAETANDYAREHYGTIVTHNFLMTAWRADTHNVEGLSDDLVEYNEPGRRDAEAKLEIPTTRHAMTRAEYAITSWN